jgi:hypothetical protein
MDCTTTTFAISNKSHSPVAMHPINPETTETLSNHETNLPLSPILTIFHASSAFELDTTVPGSISTNTTTTTTIIT